ncbi:hypothetical protein H0H81_008153 [Sphagnurus paluster]|uniref:Uncharacterized protein n=1 Tax=Sphagnurus paluster TaxID=117069 RepID=A0A9P7FQP1_9AGAR|nr:hypothetical protein H0H81_008153 [Sphagnurus paluster]
MPATYSRHNQSLSPISTTPAATPSRMKHAFSVSPAPSTSYSPTITSGSHQQKLNVVTRVAIEGKAKQDKDGASIRMYLKPGSTIPLFPEENVKILTSQVHPLDSHSVPYNFSSTLSPLLHNAARALNLPARSTETFNSAFSLTSPTSTSSVANSRISKSNGGSSLGGSENITPIDTQYTGHILVSGYNISYVVPKVFPTRPKGISETESEVYSRSSYKSRRLSIGERGGPQFMAAIDMWIPFVSRPPRSPYLLSIPTPRCLHNNIKLRIFPPTTASASFASLSSIEEDGTSWDLTSDPHVTRTPPRLSRSNSYTHFADDESSDSSTTGFSDGCGIQGTFPSADRIRVRWAKPLKNVDVPGGSNDGRRRVGVKEVKGEMTCVIRGKSKARERNGVEGLVMDVEYKGTCRGVWFPGVATLLGMDVGLETKGSDVYWVDGSPSEWEVNGGVGYTGFDVGASPRQSGLQSRSVSLDSNTPHIHIASSPQDALSAQASRNEASSSASLLRAPLPVQNVAEYSFEGSSATLASSVSSPLGTMSSMSSLMPASSPNTLHPARPPGVPVTLHVNMNEIIAPAKNMFTFTIAGTILVAARPAMSRSNIHTSNPSPTNSGAENEDPDPEPIVLPRFTVLAADSESIYTIVRNEIDGAPATVEVYNSTGDIYRDAQAKKTVLQKGGFTKCTEEGARIAFRSIGLVNGHTNGNGRAIQTPSRPRTPTRNTGAVPRVPSNPSLARLMYPPRPKRDGPLMIPSVCASVTPLLHEDDHTPSSYAVRVCLNAPADTDSEWLEFGLAHPGSSNSVPLQRKPPRVVIVNATVQGVPVKHETTAGAKTDATSPGVAFEELSSKEWISWVKIHVGAAGGGEVVVDYVVSERKDGKGDTKRKNDAPLIIFLPSFSIPVGRLEVDVDGSGVEIASLRSNFVHQQTTSSGNKLLNYSMEQFFYPHLSMRIHPIKRTRKSWPTINPFILATWALIVSCLFIIHRLSNEMKNMEQIMQHYATFAGTGWNDLPEPATITTTIYASGLVEDLNSEMPTPSPSELIEPELVQPIFSSPTTIGPPSISLDPPPTVAYTSDSLHSPEPTMAVADQYSLSLPVQNLLNFSWPVHDFDSTVEKFMQIIDNVWQLFRKVYHYPLDPT